MKQFVYPLILVLFLSCQKEKKLTAQEIVNLSIEKSNVNKLLNATVEFDFRDRHYKAVRNNGNFQLLRQFKKDSILIEDVLSNTGFKRYKNGKLLSVPDSMAVKYSESVNSVHYFSKLPLGLNDKAVIKKLLPEVTIKGKNYYKVQISFQKEGGGVDYDDVFIYWFDKENFKLDYLAYTFHVNGGGMRFRVVTKETFVNGIRFMNYANYKPINNNIKLNQLDKQFEKEKLIKASDINLDSIKVN